METNVKFDEKTRTIMEFQKDSKQTISCHMYDDEEGIIVVNNVVKVVLSGPYTMFINEDEDIAAIKSEDIMIFIVSKEDEETQIDQIFEDD